MPKTCAICDKRKSVGNYRKLLRGHRNVTGKRTFKPNLQKTKHAGQTVLACTRCIRSRSKAARRGV